jgi:hypothetical protein
LFDFHKSQHHNWNHPDEQVKRSVKNRVGKVRPFAKDINRENQMRAKAGDYNKRELDKREEYLEVK